MINMIVASVNAGALYLTGGNFAIVENSLFDRNTNNNYGGAICNDEVLIVNGMKPTLI